MSKKLSVYLNKVFIGTYEQELSGKTIFTYDSNYLKSAKAKPLSISLPLQPEPFEHRVVEPFFSALLPDEYQRELLAKNLGESERNPFALLSIVGGDCAGAIEIINPAKPITQSKTPNSPLSEDELDRIIKKELPISPLLASKKSKIRLSLAGAQSKLAVFFDEKKDLFPHQISDQPSTHILKPSNPHWDDLPYNEFFCMKLAEKIGLDVAKVLLKFSKKDPYLLVRRYDRRIDSKGKVTRIHQEDFCQALAIMPEKKYESHGGPSIAKSLQLIENHSIHPARDKLQFIHAVIFNYLIGNCDAHGKNFSFLHLENGLKFAPLYDLVCTSAYPIENKMAMRIGSNYKIKPLPLRHWHSIVPNTNTARSSLNKDLKTFATKLPKKAAELKIELEKVGIKSGIFEKVIEVINKRCDYILKYFEE